MDQKEMIKQEFKRRQTRQIVAIAITLFLVMLCAVLYKRPLYFGTFTKAQLFGGQVAAIAMFMAFAGFNWRCPSCKRYLGMNIHQTKCKCGAKFQ